MPKKSRFSLPTDFEIVPSERVAKAVDALIRKGGGDPTSTYDLLHYKRRGVDPILAEKFKRP